MDFNFSKYKSLFEKKKSWNRETVRTLELMSKFHAKIKIIAFRTINASFRYFWAAI